MKKKIGGKRALNFMERSQLGVHQSRAKWERLFDVAYFSHLQNGWLCKVCEEYSESSSAEDWRVKAVAVTTKTAYCSSQWISKTHEVSAKPTRNKADACKGKYLSPDWFKEWDNAKECEKRNRRIIKKFLKTTYFISRKKWALKGDFEDVINFLGDLGDEDIRMHLDESSTRAT